MNLEGFSERGHERPRRSASVVRFLRHASSRVEHPTVSAQPAIVCRWASYLSAAELSENKDGRSRREASEMGEWVLSGWVLQTQRRPG